MVSWALVLETVVKWLIPALCVALVGFVASKVIKPWKQGNQAQQQAQWDQCMLNSSLPKTFCENNLKEYKEQSDAKDDEILKSIKELTKTVNDNNLDAVKYHQKIDEQMESLRLGVLDAHLQNLISTCEVYIRRGYITLDEYKAYSERYETYKKLGGNGHMKHWNELIESLPHEMPKKFQSNPASITPPKTHI